MFTKRCILPREISRKLRYCISIMIVSYLTNATIASSYVYDINLCFVRGDKAVRKQNFK